MCASKCHKAVLKWLSFTFVFCFLLINCLDIAAAIYFLVVKKFDDLDVEILLGVNICLSVFSVFLALFGIICIFRKAMKLVHLVVCCMLFYIILKFLVLVILIMNGTTPDLLKVYMGICLVLIAGISVTWYCFWHNLLVSLN